MGTGSQRASLDGVASPERVVSPGQSVAGVRSSNDSERPGSNPSSPPSTNGVNKAHDSTSHSEDEKLDPVERLQQELERTRQEKENLATQYRNLLAKLTAMRTTLGNKLKQDAVRLFKLPLPNSVLLELCCRKSWTGENNSFSNSLFRMRTSKQQSKPSRLNSPHLTRKRNAHREI